MILIAISNLMCYKNWDSSVEKPVVACFFSIPLLIMLYSLFNVTTLLCKKGTSDEIRKKMLCRHFL
jgi:hypothetical protein